MHAQPRIKKKIHTASLFIAIHVIYIGTCNSHIHREQESSTHKHVIVYWNKQNIISLAQSIMAKKGTHSRNELYDNLIFLKQYY